MEEPSNYKSLEERLADQTLETTTDLPTQVATYGVGKQLATSFKRGVDDSLIAGLLPDVIARNKARSLDMEQGLKPLTPEEFKTEGFGMYGSSFEHESEETPSQTQLRFDRFVQRNTSQGITSNGGTAQTVANFGAEFMGGFVGDAPLAVVPYAAVTARVATAGKALKTGWKVAAQQAATKQTLKSAAYEQALASGSKYQTAKLVAKDFFTESVVASTVETGLWGASEQYVSKDVGTGDLLMNGAFSVAFSTPFAAFGVRNAWKQQTSLLKHNEDIDTVVNFLENGETVAASYKLADFYEPAKRIARDNEEFTFLLKDKVDISELTPEQLDAANRFSQQVTVEEMKKALANHLLSVASSDVTEGGPSQEDYARDIKSQTERIYKAIDDRTHIFLSEQDWEALVLSGYTPPDVAIKARSDYLDSISAPDYANLTFEPKLSRNNRETANRTINDYDGPPMDVVIDNDLDTLASVNPKTGRIRLNPARIKEDWDAGMPHLLGESDSASSPQKKIVFAKIDIEKFRAALGSAEGYQKFILAHEAGHAVLKHGMIKRSEWLTEAAINNEIAANEYAAALLGIDWASVVKTPDYKALAVTVNGVLIPDSRKPNAAATDLTPPVTAENFEQVKGQMILDLGEESIEPPKERQQADVVTQAQTSQERNAKDYQSLEGDRDGFFVEQTRQVLGNEAVLDLMLSTPVEYDAARDKGNVARKDHVRSVLKENNLEVFSDVAEEIVDIASRSDFYLKGVNDFFEQYNPKDKSSYSFSTEGIPDDVKRSVYVLMGENSDDLSKAQAAVIKSLSESNSSQILRTVRDTKIENDFVDGANQYSTPKQRIEWIQTQLDGQQRSGINPESSANTKSKAQIIIDAKPINDVLDKHGLWDLFIGAGSGPYLDVLRKQTGGNPDAIKIYGKDLRANINAFAGDLMVAIRTGDIPSKWKGVEAFEELVGAINNVRQGQLTQLNRAGANVRVRSDFSGWSQRWSNDTIKNIGFDRWRADMVNGVDWDATTKAHGGRLIRTDGKEVPFDKELYLKEWYYKITELREQTDGADVAKSFEQSRMLVLKPDSEAKILAKYSGEQNLGKLLMDQIRYRSEMISSLETFGSKPLETIQNTLDKSELVRGDNIGKFKYDTVLGTTRLLINDLDNPVDAAFASIFKTVRKVGNLAFLPLSGFSALMDIPLSVSTLKYTGAEVGMNEYMPQFIEAMSRQFKGDKTGMSAYFRDVGAAYDVVNNANIRQITGDVSGEKGILDLAMSFMFEANGMLRTTAAGQEAFADWTSRSLGKEAAAGKFSDLRMESLRNFGFTDADIDVLLKSYNKDAPDGINRIMPQSVVDGEVSNKLREYYLHYMKQAVLEPDAGAQAITRGNFKAGTVNGEVMRTGFQYSSFILGLSRTIFNRFANGYTGSQLNHVRAMSHLVAFIGTSLATAWFVTVLKDLSRGRAPINPLNMSNFQWQQIISQSGIVGIGEIPLELLEGSLPISPIAKAPLDLATGVLTGDRKKTAKAVAPFVGGSLPVVGGPIKSMLGMAFLEAGQDMVRAEFDYLQKF
jgi:hypothetical protein